MLAYRATSYEVTRARQRERPPVAPRSRTAGEGLGVGAAARLLIRPSALDLGLTPVLYCIGVGSSARIIG